MVTLSHICTKSGDGGRTRLGDGSQVPKTHPRVQAYGEVDELNCVLGVVLLQEMPDADRTLLGTIQNDLLDLGADLCTPVTDTSREVEALRLRESQVHRLDSEIRCRNARLPSLSTLVLPGGTAAAAWLHMARSSCRRTERSVWVLAAQQPVGEIVTTYLNRLSDLLFVMARGVNLGAGEELLWSPGGTERST